MDVLKNVRYGNFSFRKELWKEISKEAKTLIKQMLTVNPEERIKAEDAITSSWIMANRSILSADLSENIDELKREVKQKVKRAVRVIIATNKLQTIAESSPNT